MSKFLIVSLLSLSLVSCAQAMDPKDAVNLFRSVASQTLGRPLPSTRGMSNIFTNLLPSQPERWGIWALASGVLSTYQIASTVSEGYRMVSQIVDAAYPHATTQEEAIMDMIAEEHHQEAEDALYQVSGLSLVQLHMLSMTERINNPNATYFDNLYKKALKNNPPITKTSSSIDKID